MTKENNYIYFENVRITENRKGTHFIVHLEDEGNRFYVSKALAEKIAIKNNEDENLIAVILGYICFVRMCRNLDKQPNAKDLEDDVKAYGISKLLKRYSCEDIIEIMQELKWYELCEIFESQNPAEKVEEII